MQKGGVCAYLTAMLLLSVNVGPALAADFAFKIPVGLYNLRPGITAGRVSCQVWDRIHTVAANDRPAKGGPTKSGGTTPTWIGGGQSEIFPITGGAYEGSLVVQFNAGTGLNPVNGTDWACRLSLYDATMGTGQWDDADALMATSYNRTKPYKTGDQGYLR
jgi:hypothetical protein